MLSELYIQNIAVIHKAAIHFEEGLNVFTGETGAGKTILISAIDAVLGERTSREIIRTGEERAVVSALFTDIPLRARELLRELGYPDEDGAVLISREISESKNSCKIGGMPATNAILRQVASQLIHIHGQRDSAELTDPDRHMVLIDLFGGCAGLLERYRAAYDRMCAIRRELESLRMDEAQKARRIDLLTFQIEEIEQARLEDEDEEELQRRRRLIRGGERIAEGLSAALDALRGGEEQAGIDALFDALIGGVEQAAQYADQLLPMVQRFEEMRFELGECAADLRAFLDELEFDPRELEQLERRLDEIYRLKKKYGPDIPSILQFLEEAREELDAITTSEQHIRRLGGELEEAGGQAKELARELSERRNEAAERFLRLIEEELVYLDMPSARLSVLHQERELSSAGADSFELLISTNVGEAPKPLSRIASGGEISRLMLAVKNVLASKDDIPTLIFDEVDTGVSGRAAQKIGRKLQEVSRSRQVICVTHLAQVAAFGRHHLLIRKEVEEGRTYTRILPLEEEQRVRELARITSGEVVTDAALQSARELLGSAQPAVR